MSQGEQEQENQSPSYQPEFVRPTQPFLQLLKEAGAPKEVLTKKEVCFYLKEYIGSKLLYDQSDPRIIHCHKDALGKVFGVETFTIENALELVGKHTSPLEQYPKRKHPQKPAVQKQNRHLHFQAQQHHQGGTRVRRVSQTITVSKSPDPVTSSTGAQEKTTSTPHSASTEEKNSKGQHVATEANTTARERFTPPSTADNVPHPRGLKRKLRDRIDTLRSSESDYGQRSETEQVSDIRGRPGSRRRDPSFSITWNGDHEQEVGSYPPWYFTVRLDTSDDSEVLSIQSKETVLVQDSEDDLWFIEEDQIFEIQSGGSEDAFSEEYEVVSQSSDTVEGESDMNSEEELIVVCNDSDIEFWADSSDLESEAEDDSVIPDGDLWQCSKCDMKNSPLVGRCERCWNTRPGWTGEKRKQPARLKQKLQRSNSVPGPWKQTGEGLRKSQISACEMSSGSVSEPENSSVRKISKPFKPITKEMHDLSDHCSSPTPDENRIKSKSRNVQQDHDRCIRKNDLESPGSSQTLGLKLTSPPSQNTPSASTQENADTDVLDSQDFPLNLSRCDSGFLDPCKPDVFQDSQHSSQNLSLTRADSGIGSFRNDSINSVHQSQGEHDQDSLISPRGLSFDSFSGQVLSPVECGLEKNSQNSSKQTSDVSGLSLPGKSKELGQSKGSYDIDLTRKRKDSHSLDSDASGKHSDNKTKKNNRKPSQDSSCTETKTVSQDQSCTQTQATTDEAGGRQGSASPASRQIGYTDRCMICLSGSKEASIIHGKSGHQVCCYPCAKELRRRRKPCPVCRRPIQRVIKNFIV